MSLRDILRKGYGGAGHWRVWRDSREGQEEGRTEAIYALHHYGTTMLRWIADATDPTKNVRDVEINTGWGSVSDQQGVNVALAELDLPYYYSRKGGARILDLRDPQDVQDLPHYIREYPVAHLQHRAVYLRLLRAEFIRLDTLADPRTVENALAPEPYTLQASDVGANTIRAFGRVWLVQNFIGQILPDDAGKRVFLRDGILQMENDAQRDAARRAER